MTGDYFTFARKLPPPPEKIESPAVPDAESTKRNLARFHGEGAASAVEEAAINYQSPSMIAVGADAQSVSILALLVNLLLSVTCLKAPGFIERLGLTKQGALILALSNVVTWIPLIVYFALFNDKLSPYWFVLLWLLNLIPAVLLSSQRDNWMSSIVPKSIMGRYLGRRMAIKSAFYLGAFFLLGMLLDHTGGSAVSGFVSVFIIAFLAAFINFSIYWFMRDTGGVTSVTGAESKSPFGILDFFRELKERKLSRFIVFTSLFSVTVSLVGPLYAVYMLKELHFSYFSFTLVIATEYLARIVSTPFWGRMADRSGNIRVLNIVSRIIPFIPVFWLFSSNPGYFIFIQAVSGFCWGAYDLCTQNYLFKLAPPERKLRYIMYSKSLTLLCMALGGLLSVFLLQEIIPVSGSRILSIFLFSGIFRGLVALYLVPKLIDFVVIYRSSHRKSAPGVFRAVHPEKTSLYYQRDIWRKFGEKEKPAPEYSLMKDIRNVVSNAGLYRHPERWGKYLTETALAPAPVLQETANPAASGGLYYNQVIWAKYMQSARKKSPGKSHTASERVQPAKQYSRRFKSTRLAPSAI